MVQPSADILLDLLSAARTAASAPERNFVLLNRTRDALPYHASVLFTDGVPAHSGASHVEATGPYGQWLRKLAQACQGKAAGAIDVSWLDASVAADWAEWWPPHALWLPGDGRAEAPTGLFVCRETPWTPAETAWLTRWFALWEMAGQAACAEGPPRFLNWRAFGHTLRRGGSSLRRSRKAWALVAGLAALLFFPVQLTVRAQGELVPREPTVLRATVDGMARRLHVEPNQAVKAGQLLAELDDEAAASRLQVARQALATAEAEQRQIGQQALSDVHAKSQLAVVQGRVEEKRTEVAYLREQVRHTELRAPHEGVVLLDDPGNWAGRTVAAGEALLRLARSDDQEVEAWLPVADAVEMPAGSAMRLFLSSRPTAPVRAQLRLYAFEAQPRPEGGLAYRLRGQITGPSDERLGARGTVHIDGGRVPLVYWMLRRPLAALREATGW